MSTVRPACLGSSSGAWGPLGARRLCLDDSIDQRITSTVLRHSLFSAARDVAGVDHDIDPSEESLLAQVAARFA